jgi:NDP-hexose-3,4-dehydratase
LCKLPAFGAARSGTGSGCATGSTTCWGYCCRAQHRAVIPAGSAVVLTVEPDASFTRKATGRPPGIEADRHPAVLRREPDPASYLCRPHRVAGTLTNSDLITENTFWVGVYPGLSTEMIDYVVESIREFVATEEA